MRRQFISRSVCIASCCALVLGCQTTEVPQIDTSTPTPIAGTFESSATPAPERVQTETGGPENTIAMPASFDTAWERLRAGLRLQQHYQHAEVDAQLGNYRGNQRLFDLIAARAEPFLFQIIEEIEKRELPLELALLPIVESTYNPKAHSSENAVGLWQILGNTGRSLGLQQDWWYDARRDPQSATIAALNYLQALHQQFDGDWMLALAAYNTGPGNVQRALRRNNGDKQDFWSLRLAPETQNHVPRLLALARIVQDPERYAIELPPIPNHNSLTTVDIGSQIDLIKVAEILDMEESELRALNPGYLQWATHPESPQTVNIPAAKQAVFQSGLAALDRSQFVTWEHYEIRPGDNLIAIARRLNTTIDVLKVVNNLQGSRIIAGEALLIPRGSGAQEYASLTRPETTSRRTQPAPETYTIRSGDNLWLIARRFDLRSREIAAWNNISINSLLHPGQTLDLSFAQPAILASASQVESQQDSTSYTVVRGDSPARIAQMFNLELGEFLQWNNLSGSSIIYPGQQLYLAPSQ